MVRIQLFLIKLILSIFKPVPEKFLYSVGKLLGLLWFHVIRIRRKVAIKNLTMAFGNEKNSREIYTIARNNFIHYGISFLEFLQFPIMTEEKLKEKVTLINAHHLNESLKKGTGFIGLCGHYGNWDMMAIAQAMLGYDSYIITRSAKNQAVNQAWHKIREEKGVHLLPDRNIIFQVLNLLNKNKGIAMVFDQHTGGKMGVKVKFFGHDAWTMRAVALIAKKTHCPVHPIYTWREGTHHYFEAGEAIPWISCKTHEEDILNNTQNYTKYLENFIRKHPEQWLWIHRRWKP